MEGRLELKRKLARVSAAGKAVLEAEVEFEANDLVKRMKRIVPRRSGNLAKSIRKEPGPHELSWDVRAGGPLTTKKVGNRTYDGDVILGSGDTQGRKSKAGGKHVTYDYANAFEFGTQNQAADPFFFTTVRARRKAYKRRRTTALNKAVKAAVT